MNTFTGGGNHSNTLPVTASEILIKTLVNPLPAMELGLSD